MEQDHAKFLQPSATIDFEDEEIRKLAHALQTQDPVETAKRCFEFVRDEIKHSFDFRMNPVTVRASEALEHRTGYCFAKSHLLAALLRANAIPAGLCYQRLRLDGVDSPCTLHGLNAIHLPNTGWYRVDPRGNRSGVDAQFCPPEERLAFRVELPGERDLPGVHAEPLPVVIEALSTHKTWDALVTNLPDAVEADGESEQ